MDPNPSVVVLDPARVLALELPRLEGSLRRVTLRSLLTLSAGAVRVEGADVLARAPEPSIFALTHHNAWESVLAPAALIALRRGRLVRFLVDWMFVDLPWTAWLVRQGEPIPVYAKPARFGLREGHRREHRHRSALAHALTVLAGGGDVGVYPEGRRNPDPWLLGRPRGGLARLALRSGAPVVPVGVDFPARDRLRRTPRAGRFVLRVGEPHRFECERSAWLDAGDEGARREVEREASRAILGRVQRDLARLSRKVFLGVAPSREARRARLETGKSEGAARPERKGERITVERVRCPANREAALAVIGEVYRDEKRWLADAAPEIPDDPASQPAISWFVARARGEAVGVVRLAYDPPLELPADAGLELEPDVDLERLAASGRFVEVGRLMIRPRWRSRPTIVLALMRAALAEVVERRYTHLFTVVFEDDPHSPLGFHTRQLGFERVGTHRRGELACESRRILLVLDLERAYRRLTSRGAAVVSHLARGLESRLAGMGDEAGRTARGSTAPPRLRDGSDAAS
jgi:1-acyl-sn-glycerol-3-phosphate acyltransferase